MADSFVSNGVTMARGDGSSPEVFTTIPNMISMTPVGQTRALLNVTNISSVSQEYLPDLPDGQEIQLEMQYDPKSLTQARLLTDLRDGIPLSFHAVFPWVSPAQVVNFLAVVTNWSVTDLILDSVAKLAVTLKPTSDLNFSNTPVDDGADTGGGDTGGGDTGGGDTGGGDPGPGPGTGFYILDHLSTFGRASIHEAYSLRRMLGDYVGPLARIGRSSDAAEQDFGTGLDQIDPALVTTFLGGANGYITKFYGQKGHTDLVQPVASKAPAYLASALNSKPGADFNGTTHYMTANALASTYSGSDKPMTVHMVLKGDVFTLTRTYFALGSSAGTTPQFHFRSNALTWQTTRRDDLNTTTFVATTTVINEGNKVFSFRFPGTTLTVNMNGNPMQAMTTAAMDRGNLTLDIFAVGATAVGVGPVVSNYFDGKMEEIVVFSADIGAADAEVLNSNSRTYYGGPILGLFGPTASQQLPDASGGDTGEGFTCTGLARDSGGTDFWAGNVGGNVSGDVTVAPSLVRLSGDGMTKVAEILLATPFASVTNVQGVAEDLIDNTLWFCAPIQNKVHNISKAGVDQSKSFTLAGANGVAYDSLRDRLWLASGANIGRYTKAGVLEGSLFATGLSDLDMLFYDATTDLLYLSEGANGTAGYVRSYNPVTGVMNERVYRLASATGIEGVVLEGTAIYALHDGYFHSLVPAHNQLQTYARVR